MTRLSIYLTYIYWIYTIVVVEGRVLHQPEEANIYRESGSDRQRPFPDLSEEMKVNIIRICSLAIIKDLR